MAPPLPGSPPASGRGDGPSAGWVVDWPLLYVGVGRADGVGWAGLLGAGVRAVETAGHAEATARACWIHCLVGTATAAMTTVNEYLMRKGLDQYIWAFATQGFEGRECLRELMALDDVGLDRLATQTLRNAERALGVVSVEPGEDEVQYVTSVLPGLYIEIPTHRLGRAKGKTFTEYSVDVHTVDSSLASHTWHRYSEFEELRKQMEKTLASKAAAAALPKLLKKKTVGAASEAIVSERQQQLRIFLERLLVHLRSGPKPARELLDRFLGLPVELKVPGPARSSVPTPTQAVAVKLPPKLQALADRLALERDEVDDILESYDHDVDQAMQFLREEYGEQLEENQGEESEDEAFNDTAANFRESLDDLDGGWGDRYDPRSTTVEDQVTTIDETDRAQVEERQPVPLTKFNIIHEYFAADVEYRAETQLPEPEPEAAEGEADTERIDLEALLQAVQLEQYLDVLLEDGFDDPTVWDGFDDDAWSEVFEMMDIDPSHWKVLQALFTNPAAQAVITGAKPQSSGVTRSLHVKVDNSPRERGGSSSPGRGVKQEGSPARTQRSDLSSRRLARQDSSPSPQVRAWPSLVDELGSADTPLNILAGLTMFPQSLFCRCLSTGKKPRIVAWYIQSTPQHSFLHDARSLPTPSTPA